MNSMKRICATTIIVLISTFAVANVVAESYSELPAEDKIMAFLTDVVKLDVTKYTVAINSNVSYPSDLGGLPKETGKCTLTSDQSVIEVTYTFKNGTLGFCNLYIVKGSPLYTQQPLTNILEMADAFLQSYQGLTGFSDLAGAREALSSVNAFENTTTTAGNIELTLSTNGENDCSFQWKRLNNGIDFPSLYLTIRSGAFAGLTDDFHVYSIGSDEVTISSEEAVEIAMERANNTSWKVNNSDGSVVEVTNATVLEDRTSARLLSAPKEPLVLYPYWEVSLTFDKIYPGSVYGVSYSIWADTGEVFYGNLLIFGGSTPDDNNPPQSNIPTTSPPIQSSAPPESESPSDIDESLEPTVPLQQPDTSTPEKIDNMFLFAAATAIAIVIVVVAIALLFKKK